ncbi:putative RNA 2'-phosphotransferase [Kineococcus xinjiangensis]|uniref:Probable RNA 2'-phosphotransferase n=1 Tax=Kineococcus xinjiangensis TaxID=512762 RepID=A0A2S6IWL0_9ACTN|nr:RNA 2'-phosphotransferase [Kineococcus xinjiangensis]PPK98742.1 putative RNA 2'-phosphotransferase [Kineococcus xinjiangensis]
MDDVRVSKLLSRVLRHAPESVGIHLDRHGWVGVADLLDALARSGRPVGRAQLERVVAASDKQRFALDGDRIRANQGHSVAVDLGLQPVDPPELLYHGTPVRNLAAILEQGLHRGGRHHVHLSADTATAARVGARRGRPAVLTVLAGRMARDGHVFHRSANGVWLTDAVPPAYLRPPEHPEPVPPGAGG